MKITRLPYGMKTKGFIIVCDEREFDILLSAQGKSNNAAVPGTAGIYQELLGAKNENLIKGGVSSIADVDTEYRPLWSSATHMTHR